MESCLPAVHVGMGAAGNLFQTAWSSRILYLQACSFYRRWHVFLTAAHRKTRTWNSRVCTTGKESRQIGRNGPEQSFMSQRCCNVCKMIISGEGGNSSNTPKHLSTQCGLPRMSDTEPHIRHTGWISHVIITWAPHRQARHISSMMRRTKMKANTVHLLSFQPV